MVKEGTILVGCTTRLWATLLNSYHRIRLNNRYRYPHCSPYNHPKIISDYIENLGGGGCQLANLFSPTEDHFYTSHLNAWAKYTYLCLGSGPHCQRPPLSTSLWVNGWGHRYLDEIDQFSAPTNVQLTLFCMNPPKCTPYMYLKQSFLSYRLTLAHGQMRGWQHRLLMNANFHL